MYSVSALWRFNDMGRLSVPSSLYGHCLSALDLRSAASHDRSPETIPKWRSTLVYPERDVIPIPVSQQGFPINRAYERFGGTRRLVKDARLVRRVTTFNQRSKVLVGMTHSS